MTNKKLILSIAAGAAAFGVAGLLMSKNYNKKKFTARAEEAKENFKGKLQELQKKAQKEIKNGAGNSGNAVNAAKERANTWIDKATNA